MPVILTNSLVDASRDLSRWEGFARSNSGSDLLIVPTKRRIRQLSRDILAVEQGVVGEILLFTLGTLATRLFQNAFDRLRIVDESVQTILFNQAIDSSRDLLRYFHVQGRYSQIPRGTFDKIIHVIRYLKESGLSPEALAEELCSEAVDDQPKLHDIFAIYTAYESILSELGATDAEGVCKALGTDCTQHSFERAFRAGFPDVRNVLIIGFDEFTRPELGVLGRIGRMDICATIVFDFQPGNTALFGHLEENYAKLTEMGFKPVPGSVSRIPSLVVRGAKQGKADQMVRLAAERLFHRDRPALRLNCRGKVTIIKAKDRTAEVESICKLVKELIAANPSRDIARICVAMFKPQLYTPLLREQLKSFGIPSNITDRYELSESRVVAAIMGLLEIRLHDFHRNDVLKTVNSAYFDFSHEGVAVDTANLIHVVTNLKIIAGFQSWIRALDAQMGRLRSAADSPEEEMLTGIRQEIEGIRKAKEDTQLLHLLLDAISVDQSPSEMHGSLVRLLDKLHVQQQILSAGVQRNPEIVELDARAYAKFLEVLDQFVNLLEYQEGTGRVHPLGFYVQQLKTALSRERYNVREQFGQGILVTSIDETRGLPFDTMIVAGLVDGEFPSAYQSELFFGSRRMREREQRYVWENRYLFYQAVTNWTEHLYVTYPEQDLELDLVRSSFIDALLNIVDVDEWNYPGRTPFESTLYSEEDLLRYCAKLGGAASLDVPSRLEKKSGHAAYALSVERSRVRLHDLPEFEGDIGAAVSNEARDTLRALKRRIYSVSQLETYGKCPFQFFAQRLLLLNTVRDAEEEFSASDKGSILHEVLFEFYTERREGSRPPLIGCSDEEFAEAFRRLAAIAENKLSDLDISDVFWELEQELILGDKQSGRGLLWEFLAHERGRKTSFRPQYFEAGFGAKKGGMARIDSTFFSEEPVVAGSVLLRGKVDRIELGDGAFSIVDYKTGRQLPVLDDIRKGISLQLPLYLFVIEGLLGKRLGREITPAGGLYYQLREPVALKVGIGSVRHKGDFDMKRTSAGLLPSDSELKALINICIETVNRYVSEMVEGKFPLTTEEKVDKVCTYCDYKTICRIQSVRRVDDSEQEEA